MTTALPERNLDILRAVAVLLVLGSHLAVHWVPTRYVYNLGHEGVLLFFVHTALVLMGSLERSTQRGLTGWRRVRDFYIRRAFRIYPLAIVMILAVVALRMPPLPSVAHAIPATMSSLLANLTLTQNLFRVTPVSGPLWSLPLEIQMYLLLPVLFLWSRRWRTWELLCCLVGTFIVGWAQAMAITHEIPLLDRLDVLQYASCFLSGVLAYRLMQLERPRWPAWIGPALLLPLVPLYALLDRIYQVPARGWALAILVGLLLPTVHDLTESWVTRAAKQIATYSYGIYLTHVPVLIVVFVWMDRSPQWARAAALISGIVGLPILLYHTIEAPLISWGAALAGSMAHTRAMRKSVASLAPPP